MAGQGNKGRGLGGGNKNKSSSNTGSKNKGPRHGHGNKGKGGGGPSSNNIGLTISAAEKLYANQIAEGISLAQAMASNKAETIRFNDLVKDHDKGSTTISGSNNNNSTTNNTMALNQAQVNELYNSMLGRNATFGDASEYDADYWVGKTAEQVKSGIQGSSEYKNRAALVSGAGDAGISEADLDKMVLPGGFKTEHHTDFQTGQGLTDFNKDNNWISNITANNDSWVTNQNAINNVLGTSAAQNYATNVGANVGGGAIDGSTTNTDTNTNTTDTTDTTDTTNTNTNTDVVTGGQTKGWWDEFADAQAFKDFLSGDTGTSSNSTSQFDQFLQFMTALQSMGGFGGGSGWGYGGYGGFAPGGVRPNTGLNNIMNALNSFKNIGSSSGNAVTTGAANLT